MDIHQNTHQHFPRRCLVTHTCTLIGTCDTLTPIAITPRPHTHTLTDMHIGRHVTSPPGITCAHCHTLSHGRSHTHSLGHRLICKHQHTHGLAHRTQCHSHSLTPTQPHTPTLSASFQVTTGVASKSPRAGTALLSSWV